MTTYTKTQLIDMAIEKLGENPDWCENGFTLIAVSTQYNVCYGYGEFCLSDPEYINDCWQLVCTRSEFEQRITERKASKLDWVKAGKYVRTPNGSVKEILFVSEDNGVKLDDYKYYCASELYPASKPIDGNTTKPTLEWWDYEKNEPLDFPPAGTECQYLEKGEWYKTVIVGMDSTDHCVYEVNDNDLNIREFPYNGWNCMFQFRPLPKLTERQQAGLKLWRAINFNDPMTDDEVLCYCRFEDYCRPWDLGLLK